MPKSRKSKHPGRGRAGEACVVLEWRIIVVDQAPLRAGVIDECRKLMRQLEEARLEVHHFESASRPAYDRWMAANFGEMLTRRRELGEAIRRADDLIHEVHMIAMMHGGSLKSAYRRLMREREEAIRPPPEPDERHDRCGDRGYGSEPQDETDHEARERALFEDCVRKFLGVEPASLPRAQYEQMFGEFKEAYAEQERKHARRERKKTREHSDEREPEWRESPPPEKRSRLKELYRTLVRRLHPDMRADSDPTVSALWHEVQEAYTRGDEHRLETLLALCEVQADAITAGTSLAQLHAVRADLKRSLNAIRRARGAAKKDAAWQFEKRNLQQYATIVRRQLETQIHRLYL
jgi:hypothetical protein